MLTQKKDASGHDTRKKGRLVACQTLDKFWYDKDEKKGWVKENKSRK